MHKLLVLALVVSFAAGCSAIPTTRHFPGPDFTVSASSTADAPPAGAQPQSVKGGPPNVQLAPGPGTPVPSSLPFSPPGWQTYSNLAWSLTVAYPADWTAVDQAEGVLFSSSQGASIRLQQNSSPGDTGTAAQCTDLTNISNVRLLACTDPSMGSYFATFTLSGRAWELSTHDPAALATYQAMLNSLR